jgi:predicted ATPase
MLFSRGAELERMDRLLAGFGDGQGFALVLRGEAGIGKSALLDAVAGRPGTGRALRVCGTPSESEVAFSGLSELAQPLLASLADLPAHHADTLRSVLALSDGPGNWGTCRVRRGDVVPRGRRGVGAAAVRGR